jgi:hypothetical protein
LPEEELACWWQALLAVAAGTMSRCIGSERINRSNRHLRRLKHRLCRLGIRMFLGEDLLLLITSYPRDGRKPLRARCAWWLFGCKAKITSKQTLV